MRAISDLARVLHEFGPSAAVTKARLLRGLESQPRCTAQHLVQLQEHLGFLLAFPDDKLVRERAESVAQALRDPVVRIVAQDGGYALENSGLPGTTSQRLPSHRLAHELARILPHEIEIDWEALEERADLHDALAALVLSTESPALDDIDIDTRKWLMKCAGPERSGLAALLEVFEGSALAPAMQAVLYETCHVPLRVENLRGRSELRFPVARVHYQKSALARERWSLAPRIRKKLEHVERLSPTLGRERLDLATLVMVSRELEIFPLTHADERDVQWIVCGRGVEILLAGVRPEQRCAFESLYFYLVMKNGVAIAYGPASPFLGSCEMGINFFEEFRGAETRFVYTQVMRVLYHLLDVRNFYVTPYGMGKGNSAAIATGAFWFYRKLGFQTANPEVERLAVQEEERLRHDAQYRCDKRTLRRLAETAAVLDLSGGACPRFASSRLALAVTEDLLRSRSKSRGAYELRCIRALTHTLGIHRLASWTENERASLRRMAPALCLIQGLAQWSARDRDELTQIVRAKAASSEAPAGKRMLAHRRLVAGLHAVCESMRD